MQQTLPRVQEPLGSPPKTVQEDPEVQIPESSLVPVQASKLASGLFKIFGFNEKGIRLARLAKGLKLFLGVNLLL